MLVGDFLSRNSRWNLRYTFPISDRQHPVVKALQGTLEPAIRPIFGNNSVPTRILLLIVCRIFSSSWLNKDSNSFMNFRTSCPFLHPCLNNDTNIIHRLLSFFLSSCSSRISTALISLNFRTIDLDRGIILRCYKNGKASYLIFLLKITVI